MIKKYKKYQDGGSIEIGKALMDLEKEIDVLTKKLSNPKTASSMVDELRSQISDKKNKLKSLKGSGSGSVKRPPAHPLVNNMGERLLDNPAKEKRKRKDAIRLRKITEGKK